MSTTVTMLETYDAQMLDYQNDTDVAMHPSSDSWLNEATMDDDTFTNDATIEVDMDGLQEDQTTEYEMTDEVESYAPEMVDIEVEDAQPPQPAPLHDSSKPNAATPTTPHPADISIPSDSAPPHSAATLPPSSQYPVDSQLNEPYTPTDIQVEESVPSIPLRSTPPQTTQSPQDAHSGHTWALDLSRPAEEPIPVLPISLSSSFQTGEYAGSVDGGAYAEVPVSADVLELQHEEGDHEPHTMPEEEHVPTNEPSGHPFVQPAHVEEEYAAEATCQQLQQTENAEVAEQQQPETAADETCAPVESNDPHEISEGVYIDPPPPVLISLRSSEYPNICLFNRPSSRSGTPYSPTAESPGSDSLVLLHHQPVLYYEPLSSVFDALRREEYLMNSPDLRDGELILDAYDLQLAVSEDNVYAREVTLHDLNVIHDGSDIAGPLRLRLRSSVPRFAFRYHQLRDQITRLHLATELAEAGENVEHQPVEDSHEQVAPETEQPEANAVPEPSLPQDTSTDAPENDRLEENKDEAAQEPFLSSETQWDDHNGRAQTDPNDTQEGEHEGPNTYDSLPEEDAHAVDGAGEPFAAPDVPDVYEEAETGEESTVAQESNDYAEDDGTHEDVEQDYPDLPDDDDGDDGPEAAPHEVVDEPVLPTVLDTSDETREPPPEGGVGQDTYEAPAEESVQQDNTASAYVDVEEPFVPTELTDAAEAAEQAGSSIEIGLNIPDGGDVDAALDPPLEANGFKNVEPNLQEINEFEEWDDELDGDGELDSTWDEQESPSAQSSVTVSSTKTSMKRSLDETDFEELVQEGGEEVSPGSPSSKRVRTQ